jgi:hypothetical protein
MESQPPTRTDAQTVRLGEHDYPPEFVALSWSTTDPEGYILALHNAKLLGYVKPADEWVRLCEPLSDRLQDVAHALVADGRLPAETYGLEASR